MNFSTCKNFFFPRIAGFVKRPEKKDGFDVILGKNFTYCCTVRLLGANTIFFSQRSEAYDMYFEPTSCISDRHPNGVNAAQKESSLFSSSLSDLFTRKLKLSRNSIALCPNDSYTDSQCEETEAQTLKSLLPDEEELFLGMVDDIGNIAEARNVDDSEDFDLFSCSGGIELEADDHLWTNKRNVGLNRGISLTQCGFNGTVSVGHPSGLHSYSKLPNGASPQESSRVTNSSHSSIRVAAVANQFRPCDPSHSLGQVMLDNQLVPNFHSHSLPKVRDCSASDIPWKSLEHVTDIASDTCFKATGKITRSMHQMGSDCHAMELNRGAFGYSPDANHHFHVSQYVSGNSNPSEHYPSRSLYWPNFPSCINGEHAQCPAFLPGFPSVPDLMMTTGSPIHHHQVGSAPVMNASLWDRQQAYVAESLEASSLHPGFIGSIGIPGYSPPHPSEVSSYNIFPHSGGASSLDLSKSVGLLSPRQMCHMFQGRNTFSTMQSSFGSPGERVRNRRNEANSSYADKKQYELNIDRILRGENNRTTLMIKNIPNKYTSKMLLATIDEKHRGMYDFIYLPIDFKNKCNVGYAFINMVEPLHIVPFYQTFEGKKWEKFNSEKVASLAYARIQGKAALIAHFQNSSLMNEDKRCRPILFHTDGPNAGDQEPFPMGTNIRSRPGRLQTSSNEDDDHIGQSKCTEFEESSNGTNSSFDSTKG
ncbi:hypothetical protein Nepgr_025320 [Nepenthes gracilis]|uniref:Mei2-like C-terminal RNA recognition motif domain-containing protein n=1 Tax=Nepenthes gracilis TaxID=150966 RepID=A0AAD3T7H0_NEPGR|nr:hypothetical protein Nepgr_025320 [Nepenthes gracilis]